MRKENNKNYYVEIKNKIKDFDKMFQCIRQALGIGFSRTQSIGSGGHKCDARFKRGGETANGWPPEELAEWREIEPIR